MDKTLPNDVFFQLVTQQLSEGKTVNVPLTGSSMSPTLKQGRDNLILAPLPPQAKLCRYDVVLFRYRGTHLLHRIVKIHADTIVTRGDALVSTETPQRSNVVAKLVAVKNVETGRLTQCNSLAWHWRTLKGVFWKQLKRTIKRLLNR